MKESSKNITIFVLFIIFVGLCYLLYYSISYQKKLNNEEPVINNRYDSKILNFDINSKSIKVNLTENIDGLELSVNKKKISTYKDGKVSNNNTFEVVEYDKEYLFINIKSDNGDKPILINEEGLIVYEFDTFIYNGLLGVFKDDESHENFFIQDKKVYLFSELIDTDEVENREEFSRKNMLDFVDGNFVINFIEFAHGKYI
jgi:hypothetical protein